MKEEGEKKKICVRWGRVALLVIGILLLYLYLTARSEGFTVNPASWEDWDNYDTRHGSSRAYWGEWLPGGGWSGSRYSPRNNPGGDYIFPWRRRRGRGVDLTTNDEEVLQDVLRSQIAR